MIGATIVSLGTTTPEAAVSVLAAFKGSPDLALGNAVGSIICDTGLILGLATLISPLPLDRKIVNRQGWIQIGAGFVLILGCVPYSNISGLLESGGRFPQWVGFVFLLLLAVYLWLSVKWSTGSESQSEDEATGTESTFVALLTYPTEYNCRDTGCIWYFPSRVGYCNNCSQERTRRVSSWQHHRCRHSECIVCRWCSSGCYA